MFFSKSLPGKENGEESDVDLQTEVTSPSLLGVFAFETRAKDRS